MLSTIRNNGINIASQLNDLSVRFPINLNLPTNVWRVVDSAQSVSPVGRNVLTAIQNSLNIEGPRESLLSLQELSIKKNVEKDDLFIEAMGTDHLNSHTRAEIAEAYAKKTRLDQG